jgi:hypothetical protein
MTTEVASMGGITGVASVNGPTRSTEAAPSAFKAPAAPDPAAPEPEAYDQPLGPTEKIVACIFVGLGFASSGAVGVWAALAAGSPALAILLALIVLISGIAAVVSLARSGPHRAPPTPVLPEPPAQTAVPAPNRYAQEGFLRRGRDVGTVA